MPLTAVRFAWFVPLAAGLGVPVTSEAQPVRVFNPSFEEPVVSASQGVRFAPTAAAQGAGPADSPWVFGTDTGVVAAGAQNGGSFIVPPAPDGNQWGYLINAGQSISQVLTFPAAGTHTVTLEESGDDPLFFGILIDNSQLATESDPPGPPVRQVSAAFNTMAGQHTLTLRDDDPRVGPVTFPIYVDAVTVIPEPAIAVLLVVVAPVVLRRRRSVF
jgi:hypothetical protein